MNLLQWSFHIRSIGVEGLETLTYSEAQLKDQILSLKNRYHCSEVFYLATCNRVEFLLCSHKPFKATEPDFTQLKPSIKTQFQDIIHHWLSVCCSLDSVVFGENQILGQVKKSFAELKKQGLIQTEISKFLNLIFRESKWIRNHSSLSRIQTSVSAVAAKKIQTLLSAQSRILLVGFGETNQLVYKYLRKKQKYELYVTNRTLSKVETSVDSQTHIVPWESFSRNDLGPVDAIVLAVTGQKHLLDEQKLKTLQPKYVLDLSVPANADEHLVSQNSTYIGLDEIKNTVEANKDSSALLIKEVESLVLESTHCILNEFAQKSLDEIITLNLQKTLDVQTQTLQDHRDLMKSFSLEQLEVIKKISERLVKKINHIHLKSIKEVYSELTKHPPAP